MDTYKVIVFHLEKDDTGEWIAQVLTPTSTTPTEVRGFATSREAVVALRERYPEGVLRLTEYFWKKEIEKRTPYTCHTCNKQTGSDEGELVGSADEKQYWLCDECIK